MLGIGSTSDISLLREGLAQLADREKLASRTALALAAALTGLVVLFAVYGLWVLLQPSPASITEVDVPSHLMDLYAPAPAGDPALGRQLKWGAYGVTAAGFILMAWRMNVVPMLLAFGIGGGLTVYAEVVNPSSSKPSFSSLSYAEALQALGDLPSLDLDAKAYVQAQLAIRFKRDDRATLFSVAEKIRQGTLSFTALPATAYAIEITADGRAVSSSALQGAKEAAKKRDEIEDVALGIGWVSAALIALSLKAVGVHQFLRRRRLRVLGLVKQLESLETKQVIEEQPKQTARSLLRALFTG